MWRWWRESSTGSGRLNPDHAGPPEPGADDGPLADGRTALTDWTATEAFRGFTFLEIRSAPGERTRFGRTWRRSGHPVAGDRLYGAKRVP